MYVLCATSLLCDSTTSIKIRDQYCILLITQFVEEYDIGGNRTNSIPLSAVHFRNEDRAWLQGHGIIDTLHQKSVTHCFWRNTRR